MLQIEALEHDPAHTPLQQCVPMHSRFQTPIDYKILFFCPSYYFAPSSPRHYFFASIVILFTPRRQTNERTNEQTNERTNGNSPLLTSCSSFAYHYQLFAFCIRPLSFATRSATTMTTAIGTTTMLMATPPLLHVAQKSTFKFLNVNNMGKPSQFFFRCTPIPLENLVVQVTNKSVPILSPHPSATITDTFTQLGRFCPHPFAYFSQQFSHSHYNSLLPLDISLTTTPNIACTIAL
jgi:hypothetical protein